MTGKIIQKRGGKKNKKERGEKTTPSLSITGTISALITHPELGSLELNLHFKLDFKDTPLCSPPKKTPGPCGKKLLRLLETETRLGAGDHRSCLSQRGAQRWTDLAEPLLTTGCSLSPSLPWG